ncbi:MAG TPA: 1,4-alpha-glucan branching protein GlgB [Mariprofundaceae bacterium]|nr:1,4-alpha-glucan branching protein GlgB [Mariprofundaceae bacterium]
MNSSDTLEQIVAGQSHDPFSWLGRHAHDGQGVVIRAFLPLAVRAWVLPEGGKAVPMQRLHNAGAFEVHLPEAGFESGYRLRLENGEGHSWEIDDPYRFSTLLSDYDLYLIGEGNHFEKYKILGAHVCEHEGVSGVSFAVWAPNAQRVSVVGNFNHWDGRVHPMRVRGGSGVWELFVPELCEGEVYKFEIRTQSGDILLKVDPYAQQMELRPATACIVHDPGDYQWHDHDWMEARRTYGPPMDRPINIYEVHLGSWRRGEGGYLNYRELAHQLVEYCQWMGYTHIELLPITEHPYDASWGYQTVGYFAPTSRFGTPDDFRYLIDYCHDNGMGVFLDWVPAHFPKDSHGLARFDGTALYEHEDSRIGEHKEWGTYIFNYGRNEVRNFLIASALFWLDQYHIDGLRVDAVASMLYLDYDREDGEWLPNRYGGRENLEAVEFLKQFNHLVHERFPGAVTMAEESTSWAMVSRPTWLGGLGFTMKWNMGWMNDTLRYFSQDPVHRSYHHNVITFSQVYAYTENFILPFSHDEVVHGKGSMPNKMPGDDWQRFANLRALYGYQYTHPGKKLQFMGTEFGQWAEWKDYTSLDWDQSGYMPHHGVQLLMRDLNHLVRDIPALHEVDFEQHGFQWIDCNDASQSTLSHIRRDAHGGFVVVVLNLTPVPRKGFRLGVPQPGTYREILNTDAEIYGGSNMGNAGEVQAESLAWMDQPHSITLVLPALSCLILRPVG